jgi:limonene-1,2-epoxide hydrolase
MLDPLDDAVSKMTASIENELVVRDFLDNVKSRDVAQLVPFLGSDVVYQPNSWSRIRGRAEVLRLCEAIFGRFEVFEFVPIKVATCESMVMLDQTLHVRFPGEMERVLMSFASFEVRDFQIVSWRQLQG